MTALATFRFDGSQPPFHARAMNRSFIFVLAASTFSLSPISAADSKPDADWRALPLIADGKVHPNWTHVGYGSFVVDDGALRTECDPRGLGLLVYQKERFGNCQLRVV